jgi:hypothetical protein
VASIPGFYLREPFAAREAFLPAAGAAGRATALPPLAALAALPAPATAPALLALPALSALAGARGLGSRRAASRPHASAEADELGGGDELHVRQLLEDPHRRHVGLLLVAADHQFRVGRRLVGVVDARHVGELMGQRPLVEPLGVPGLERLHGSIHEDLDEPAHVAPDQVPGFPERRKRGHHHPRPVPHQHARHGTEAADRHVPVLLADTEASGEDLGRGVAVEHLDVAAHGRESLHDLVRQGRLPGAGHAGEPDDEPRRLLHVHASSRNLHGTVNGAI